MFDGRLGVVTQAEQTPARAALHIRLAVGRGDTYMSSIHLVDAAAAVVEALVCQAGTYNIVDDEPVTKRAHAATIAAAAGVTPWLTGPGSGGAAAR